jgi:hypothetical protein
MRRTRTNKIATVDMTGVGAEWVRTSRKKAMTQKARTTSATAARWVITRSSSPGVKPGTTMSTAGRRCGPGAVRKARQRQRQLEAQLDGQRLEQFEKARARKLVRQGVDSLGCAPLVSADADGVEKSKRRVSYGTIVDRPFSTAGQSGRVEYRSKARRGS